MEKYRIGVISKVMGIPIDTLRYFESIGLLQPKRDISNGYRYYDVNDIFNLLDYQRYRKLDFSSRSVVNMIQSCGLTEYIAKMEEACRGFSTQLERYKRLSDYYEEYVERLRTIKRDLDRFRIVTMPEFYYFVYRTEAEFAPVDEVESMMEAWLRYTPFVEQFCRINLEYLQKTEEPLPYRYGMSITKKWAVAWSVDTGAAHIHYVPSQMAVRVIVSMQDTQFRRSALLGGLQYIKDHRFVPAGPIMGNVLAKVHDEEGKPVQYVELYFPITE